VVQVDGYELVTNLPTPVAPGRLRNEVRKIGDSAVATNPKLGARISILAEGGVYSEGKVCYVMAKYCDTSCAGQWCVMVTSSPKIK
jgi:hypothetical protein